jgi:hypothetical protein
MPKNRRQLLPILVTFLATILIASAVFANSAMPPNRHWFKFSANTSTLTLQSFKILWCSSATQCQPPKLVVVNYNISRNTSQPHAEFQGANFRYADNLFFWSMYGTPQNFKHLQIIGQYFSSQETSVRSLSSNIFNVGSWDSFAVTINDQSLVVQPQDKNSVENRILQFFKFEDQALLSILLLALSVGSELAVAFFLLRKFNLNRTKLSFIIALIIVMHGFSLPIVWKSFPSFAAFISAGERGSGSAWLVLSLFYPLLLVGFNKQKPLTDEKRLVRSIVYLFFTWVFSGAFWILDYGTPDPEDTGLPGSWVIPLAEIFVWLYEAWILWIVTRPYLNRLQALMLSLVMNIVSFGLGSVFINLFFG